MWRKYCLILMSQHYGVSSHRQLDSLFNCLSRQTSAKTSQFHIAGLLWGKSRLAMHYRIICEGNHQYLAPSQRANNAGLSVLRISCWTKSQIISRLRSHDAHVTDGTISSRHNRAMLLNPSPPSAAYMRQWIGSALVRIMACRLNGAKPLS